MSTLLGVDPQVLITLALDLGARYSVYKPATDLRLARCPRCKARTSPLDLHRVSQYVVTFPKTEACPECEGTGGECGCCVRCDGRGFHVVGTVKRTADLACGLCCAEWRRKGTGLATCYTRGAA